MIPELGHFALILALLVALIQGTLPLVGAAIGAPRLMAVSRPAARAQALLVALAFAALAWSFVSNDFSVKWWNTLHQGATVSLTAAPKMAAVMLAGMMAMAFAAWFYSIAVALTRVRAIILERERHTGWVADAVAVRR